ncbi:MAG: pyridoxal phosphate-dependent aminotransferase [Candidatus Hodarchaeales archaeon]|jgi:aspartate/methionine/tyrosine aminotransferase
MFPKNALHIDNVMNPPIVVIANKIKNLVSPNQSIVSFGQGVPFFGPPEFALKELSVEMLNSESLLHRYSIDEGLQQLRELVAENSRKKRINVTSDQVLITTGANQAFYIALSALCNPGDEFIVPTPFYFNHVMAIQLVHGVPIFVPRLKDDMDLDIKAIREAITPKTKGIILTSPDNPTGSVYPKKTLDRLFNIVYEQKLYVIHDETYAEFIYDSDHPHVSMLSYEHYLERTIGIYSFSKVYGMAGYRLGYLLFPEMLRSALMKIQDTIVVCPPVIAQQLALILLTNEKQTKMWFSSKLTVLNSVREFVLQQIKEIPQFYLSQKSLSGFGGFYLFPEVINHKFKSLDNLIDQLIHKKAVVLIPGNAFGDYWKTNIRIAYGNVSLDQAQEGFERIRHFFEIG